FLNSGKPAVQLRDNSVGGLARILRALCKRIKHDKDRSGIRGVRKGRSRKPDHVHGTRYSRHVERDLDGEAVDLIGTRERGTRRKLDNGDQIAPIERRNEAHRCLAKYVET